MRKLVPPALLTALALAYPGSSAFADTQDYPAVQHGHDVAIQGDCAACHTDPGSGHDLAGGRAIQTPFGTILAPNITPDRDTGIGAWSDDEFAAAMTKGIGRHGEHLYPAMPYPAYTKMSADDIKDLRAYLMTVPPVRHEVVADQLSFPFNIRAAMIAWNWLFFSGGTFQPQPDKSAEWNRGAYLVEGPMHCGTCHTPKNFMGADESSSALTGYTLQGWFAPNLTGDARVGLGKWGNDEIVAYLKTGHNTKTAASGPMGEEVALSSSKMSDADLRAIATYLKTVPTNAPAAPAPLKADDPMMKAGAAIYVDQCEACHKADGTGVPGLFPALAGSASVQSIEATSLMHVVLVGTQSVGTAKAPTAPAMPAFGQLLTDDQVAKVVTYIRNGWGNAAPAVSAGDVKSLRQELHDHPEE